MIKAIFFLLHQAAVNAASTDLAGSWRFTVAVLLDSIAVLAAWAFAISVMRSDRAAVNGGKPRLRKLRAPQYVLFGTFVVGIAAANAVVGRSHVAEYAGWDLLFSLLSVPPAILGLVLGLRSRDQTR